MSTAKLQDRRTRASARLADAHLALAGKQRLLLAGYATQAEVDQIASELAAAERELATADRLLEAARR